MLWIPIWFISKALFSYEISAKIYCTLHEQLLRVSLVHCIERETCDILEKISWESQCIFYMILIYKPEIKSLNEWNLLGRLCLGVNWSTVRTCKLFVFLRFREATTFWSQNFQLFFSFRPDQIFHCCSNFYSITENTHRFYSQHSN